MIHQLHRGLLFRNLDVFHGLLFGFVTRDFHNGDGRDANRLNIYMMIFQLLCMATDCVDRIFLRRQSRDESIV